MVDANKGRFEARLKTLETKTKPGARIHTRVADDGLVVDEVRSERRGLIPVRSVVLAAAFFLALKGFIFAQLGENEYLDRIGALSRGTGIEVAAAFFLDADPATRFFAKLFDRTLK